MSPVDEAPRCVLEDVTHLLSSIDPRERRSQCGRLILAPDALHYVPGWEVHGPNVTVGSSFGAFGAVGGYLFALAARGPNVIDTPTEGGRLLAQVRSLPPAEQVRTISGSVTVPVTDIGSARLSLLASVLAVVTSARGEVLNFVIERRHRKQVKAWLAALPRK